MTLTSRPFLCYACRRHSWLRRVRLGRTFGLWVVVFMLLAAMMAGTSGLVHDPRSAEAAQVLPTM